MPQKPSKPGLLDTMQEASNDPLSIQSLQRLWQADYTAGVSEWDRGAAESLGALSKNEPAGAVYAELGRKLDRFRHPALIVRSDGRIEAMNLRARRSINADPGEPIDTIGYELVPSETLSRKIARFLDSTRNSPSSVDLWQALESTTERAATLAAFRNEWGGGTALLFVIDPIWKGEAEALARQAFGLTSAELEILKAFLNGRSLREIAEYRGRSPTTVRTQFHAIMSKFGVQTQAELVRSALGLSQFLADVAPMAQLASHPHRQRFQVLRPGGRCVDIALAGMPGGAVVIYLAECTLNTFAANIEARFHAAGLCVVSVSRPGYGATQLPADGQDDLECMAADVEAVAEQLGMENVVIAGHGTSAALAFSLAAARPRLTRRIVVFAGTVPRPYIDQALTHAPFAAALLRAREASPDLFRLIVRTSGAAWRRLGTRRFNSLNLSKSEADSAIARDATCLEEFDEALSAQFANGYALLESDLLLTTSDWTESVIRCAAPTLLLHGTQDPVTNIGTVRKFARNHSHLTVEEVQDAGYLLHHTHTDIFVRALSSDP